MVSVLKAAFWPVVIVALGLWITFFSFEGRFGLKALEAAESRLVEARELLASLETRRDRLAKICDQLDGAALDRDLVEERARVVLGYAHPEDVILTRSELERLIGRVAD